MNQHHRICFVLMIAFSVMLSGCALVWNNNNNNTHHSIWPTRQNVFSMPAEGNDLVGHTFTISSRKGDTLSSLGYLFDVGIVEMRHANPSITSRQIKVDTTITVPTQYILPPK